jgi:alpha-tubulin suppressor-like RCC1 family protein
MNSVARIALGEYQTGVIDKAGHLYVLGNERNILDENITMTPPTLSASNVRDVIYFEGIIMFTKNDNTLWQFGNKGLGRVNAEEKGRLLTDASAGGYNEVYSHYNGDLYYRLSDAGGSELAGVNLADGVVSFGYSRLNDEYQFMMVSGDRKFALRLREMEYTYIQYKEFPDFTLDNIEYISSSSSNVAIIDSNANLWIWGENKHGEIGDDFSLPRTIEERFNTLSDVIDVSIGLYKPYLDPENGYTIALTSNGDVYAWGSNDFGQLVTGDTELRLTPTKIMLAN